MKTLLIFILSLVFTTLSSCQEQRTVKCTVLNEDGSPVVGAEVHIAYIGQTPESGASIKGLSNPLGVFVANGSAPLRIKIMVAKKGYYSSVVSGLSKLKDHELNIVLRKIKKPIPLYAQRAKIYIPLLDKPCGFDFREGDWVAPHGKGKRVMCFFEMKTIILSNEKHTQKLLVSFPNTADGIIAMKPDVNTTRSEFKFQYEAPANNYLPKLLITQKRIPKKDLQYSGDDYNYILRLNSVSDNDGSIVSSNYLRINRGLSLFGVLSENPGFKITYYYNPTPNDRNLEFDPRRNLFKNLKSTEEVGTP